MIIATRDEWTYQCATIGQPSCERDP